MRTNTERSGGLMRGCAAERSERCQNNKQWQENTRETGRLRLTSAHSSVNSLCECEEVFRHVLEHIGL